MVASWTDGETTVLTEPVKVEDTSITGIAKLTNSLYSTLPDWDYWVKREERERKERGGGTEGEKERGGEEEGGVVIRVKLCKIKG